eukprot:Phypoly_transcript_14501.p1 GENE.Phypoly_transcript_14501~~Phypoly_transcript_14501.p1  ORF type:complete len:274 (+),score=33.09 Phypoly_transcript_14501:89-910(+)
MSRLVLFSSLFLLSLFASCFGECDVSGDYSLVAVTGHYYRAIECYNETWEAANEYAHSLVHPDKGPGYLMTIGSAEEQNILYSGRLLAPSSVDVFVGGYDEDGTNNWVWTGANTGETFYSTVRGCMEYCNFAVGQPATPSSTGPQGLRLRLTRWIAGSSTEVLSRAFGFVEFGCCDCALNGVCNETSCTCTCGSDWIGPHCDVYVGPCQDPTSPICVPAEPICIKTSAPTDAPTNSPTNPPTNPTDPPTYPPTNPPTNKPTHRPKRPTPRPHH